MTFEGTASRYQNFKKRLNMNDASDNLPLNVDQGLIPLEGRSGFPTSRALKSPQE